MSNRRVSGKEQNKQDYASHVISENVSQKEPEQIKLKQDSIDDQPELMQIVSGTVKLKEDYVDSKQTPDDIEKAIKMQKVQTQGNSRTRYLQSTTDDHGIMQVFVNENGEFENDDRISIVTMRNLPRP